ncbi:hypothetical protein AB4Z42_16640 [Mycobacterium sp. 2YAF39]|uniref:hypothetical protein n=1 Tax=Mycobacterium sp. 2YAF39 TaxID=3233033 RepID=UPI003F976F65
MAAISPPEFELYESAGLYNRQYGVINSAPCGVEHRIAMVPRAALWGGFAAPPQLDLYARTPYSLGARTFE